MNISQALTYGTMTLKSSDSPEIDSQALLCHVLRCTPTYLHMWSDKLLTDQQQRQFKLLVEQRLTGLPVAYVIGLRGFWSLDLKVSPATLIPRPDTELLVSLALTKLKPEMMVADLGTGSGAIALSIAHELPALHVLAMDFSQAALELAHENAIANGLSNVHFWQGSWLEAVSDKSLDMVVSNPPYIEQHDPHLSQGDVRFEPITALASGCDGLDDIRLIVQQAQRCLKPLGWLMVEHGYHQSEQVQFLFNAAGFDNVSAHKDFGGQDRVVIGQLTL
ncbi:MAG: peptide chain release factor N(5)-glutamine methyltransferase [Gammaproteobacteria bacterium]|nr:peptide chain release factor N(5)-glutamine methyltransferase [Gammaproteobacteria bacterium]